MISNQGAYVHLTKYNGAQNKEVVETSLCADVISGFAVAIQSTVTSKQDNVLCEINLSTLIIARKCCKF